VRAFIRHPFTQIAFGVLALALVVLHIVLLRSAAALHWNDFGKFYYATLNWRAGASMYAPTVATYMSVGREWLQFLDMNPPHFHLLILPFLWLPEQPAGAVWSTLNVAAAIVACAMVLRELSIRIEPSHLLPWFCVVLASAATAANSVTGQCTGLLMAAMTAAWFAARRQRWTSCGGWIGVLVSLKPFLALFFLMFVLLRLWRALVAACLVSLACVVVGVLVFGWPSHLEWLSALRDVEWPWAGMNGSLWAVLSRGLDRSPYLTPFTLRPGLILPLGAVGSLLVATLSARAVWASRSIDHAFAVAVLASLLISPLGWVYYQWLAFPPVVALWHRRMPVIAWVGLALLCVPLFSIGTGQPHPLATITIGSAYVWGTLALWTGLVQSKVEPSRPKNSIES
jgi:hypothetical protein